MPNSYIRGLRARLDYYSMEIDGHLIWCGSLDAGGYGSIMVGGLPRKAHRLTWELAHGYIPPGMFICHKNTCHHPACIRVDHLYLGTPRDNRLDMVAYENERWDAAAQANGWGEDR